MKTSLACLLTWLCASGVSACDLRSPVGPIDLSRATLTEVAAALEQRTVTSEQVVKGYLRRIEKCDRETRAILFLNPEAMAEAKRLDSERRAGQVRGVLHGVPIIVKDNIDVAGMVTTAGSLALAQNLRSADAPLVQRLKAAGAIVLAKSNLSEWANFRSFTSSSGWSAVGGLTRNPHDPLRTACGSSSGSGVAMALKLAAATVGTETNGSVVCPSSVNGIVGLKPTVGLIPGAGIVPISHTQDTAGPMTTSVADAALLLSVMADSKSNYSAPNPHPLQGVRLGVAKFMQGWTPATQKSFDAALALLKSQGAVLVDIEKFDDSELGRLQLPILLTEFKADLNAYLATAPAAVRSRTLKDLIEFNRAEPRELEFFGQELFEQAEATQGLDDPEYRKQVESALRIAGPEGIDKLLREHDVVALLSPSYGPGWSIDLINGDPSIASSSTLAAMSGYPHLTVPMDPVSGMPVGLSIFGAARSEQRLLSLGLAFETARAARGRR
jgi:amidase